MPDSKYKDDLTIDDEDDLWRRINPIHWVEDKNLGRKKISTAAFRDSSNGSPMSVDLANECPSPEYSIRSYNGFFLAAISAGLARKCAQGVARDPLPEEPAHALVFGEKTRPVQKRFVGESRWIIPPADA